MTTTTLSLCSAEPEHRWYKSPAPTRANLLKAATLFDSFADDTDFGRMMRGLTARVRLMAVPLDLDRLVKAGRLRRLSATRYRVLCDDLPPSVWARAVHLEPGEGGTVLTFRRKR